MKMLLALPLLLQAATPAPSPPRATIDGLPLGAIPKQELPAKGCAAYLWTVSGTHALIAMAAADPALLRLSIDGKVTDLYRAGQAGAGGFGFAATSDYGGGSTSATLSMTVETRATLTNGAAVPQGTLRIDRAGEDTVVVPVAGLIGCA